MPSGDQCTLSFGPRGRLGIAVVLPVAMFKRRSVSFHGFNPARRSVLVPMTICFESGAKSNVKKPSVSFV
ncbi:MAG: hypothetical protein ACYS1E_09625 [Planctomycetota bacterium]